MNISKRKRVASGILIFLILAASASYAQNYGASTPSAVGLSCDGKGNAPDNVSTYNPMLSWTFSDADSDDAQSSYNIQVWRDDNGSVVWDLADQDLTTSTRMYAGTALQPNTRYNWSVEVRDRAAQSSTIAIASFQILDIGLRAFDGTSNISVATDRVNPVAPVTDANRLRIAKSGSTYSVLLGGAAEHGASKIHVQVPSGTKALKMMVSPPPAVGVGPGYLIFNGPAGTNPGAQSVSVQNVGDGSLTGLSAGISYGSGSGWLSTSYDTTTAPATLTVTPAAASLAAGVYTATVAVNSGVAANTPQNVNVTLQLTAGVTYDANGATGGSVPNDPNSYLPGTPVVLLGNSGGLYRTGYTFSGWQIDGAGTTYTEGHIMILGVSAVTLYAKWTAISSTVNFNAQGGSAPNPASKTVTYDSIYGTLATTSRTGYVFGGWWTGTGGTGTQVLSTTNVTITADQTLYAMWTAISSTVSFDDRGGSGSNPASITVTYDATYGTLPSTSRTGYTFDGWHTGTNGTGSRVTSGTTVTITSDQTLYADWVVTWTATTMPADAYWWSVAYGNGVFVATAGAATGSGPGTLAATSSNGTSWTLRTLPSSQLWVTVTYGGGKFVALGYASDQAATSTDGINWTARTMPSTSNWMSVTYGNGTFVAIAEGVNGLATAAATSPDGITWTARTLPVEDRWSDVVYGNGMFVAVAGFNTTSSTAASSPDGVTWTLRDLPISAQWSSVAYGNGTFVTAATNSSTAATSPDGITWTARTLPYDTAWYPVGFGESFVVVSYNSTLVATSSDGITWRAGTMPSKALWDDVAYGNGTYVVVARNSSTAAEGP